MALMGAADGAARVVQGTGTARGGTPGEPPGSGSRVPQLDLISMPGPAQIQCPASRCWEINVRRADIGQLQGSGAVRAVEHGTAPQRRSGLAGDPRHPQDLVSHVRQRRGIQRRFWAAPENGDDIAPQSHHMPDRHAGWMKAGPGPYRQRPAIRRARQPAALTGAALPPGKAIAGGREGNGGADWPAGEHAAMAVTATAIRTTATPDLIW